MCSRHNCFSGFLLDFGQFHCFKIEQLSQYYSLRTNFLRRRVKNTYVYNKWCAESATLVAAEWLGLVMVRWEYQLGELGTATAESAVNIQLLKKMKNVLELTHKLWQHLVYTTRIITSSNNANPNSFKQRKVGSLGSWEASAACNCSRSVARPPRRPGRSCSAYGGRRACAEQRPEEKFCHPKRVPMK